MKLNGDEPAKKSNSLALKSAAKSVKASKVWNSEEAFELEGFGEDSDDE